MMRVSARAQLRLTPEQAQEKEGIEENLTELKEALTLEEDAEKKTALEEELRAGQEKLDQLMDSIRVRRLLLFRLTSFVFVLHASQERLDQLMGLAI